jgi:hypothetical protein
MKKNIVLKIVKKMAMAVGRVDKDSDCGVGSGSGLLQLAPIDRGGQGDSNGTG